MTNGQKIRTGSKCRTDLLPQTILRSKKMNFINRALRYIQRTPTKTLLLVITFFVIGNLVILGLGVSEASENAKILTRQKMRPVISYEIDFDKFWNYAESLEDVNEREEVYKHYPKLNVDVAKKLSEDERVVAENFMNTDIFYGIELEHVPLGNGEKKDNSYVDENGKTVTYTEPGFMINASQSTNMIELEEGRWTITDGRFLNEDDLDQARFVAVITQDLAAQNFLRVGDTITVSTADPNRVKELAAKGGSESDYYMELEVIGLYDTVEEVDANSPEFRWMAPYSSPKNRIILPLSAYTAYQTSVYETRSKVEPEYYGDIDPDEYLSEYGTPSQVYYLLDDPLHVPDFARDYSASMEEFQKLNANDETFRKMARPLDTMSFFANIVVWIVVVNAVIIISLVTALTLKTREYEIGVLLSIGVSKAIVVAQLFLELLVIACVGFAAASVSGSMMAGKVGDLVLDFQTTADAQYETEEESYFSSTDSHFTEVSQDEMFSQYHVSISPLLIIEIYILGTGVVLISILIPSAMIMRLNPKQILLQ